MAQHEMSRRELLETSVAASVGAALAGGVASRAEQAAPASTQAAKGRLIWANLLHLSYNMWCDWDSPEWPAEYGAHQSDLRFEQKLWDELLRKMVDVGMTMVVIDLGDGVRYQSHPEIAVNKAWSVDQLKSELAKIRKMGLEPIPKLNWSASRDAWLGKYSRCVSTDAYYAVCRDLIAEVIQLFDKPRFFHLGMDEEEEEFQKYYQYMVVRQFDLWWHDFLFLVEQVTRGGSRPWIWSDCLWRHPEEFYKRMPKTVVQGNWYYDTKFTPEVIPVKAYHDLDQHGYDLIPTGSNWSSPESFGLTVDYCGQHLSRERLLGFLQTPWKPTLEACRQRHIEAIEQAGRAITKWSSGV